MLMKTVSVKPRHSSSDWRAGTRGPAPRLAIRGRHRMARPLSADGETGFGAFLASIEIPRAACLASRGRHNGEPRSGAPPSPSPLVGVFFICRRTQINSILLLLIRTKPGGRGGREHVFLSVNPTHIQFGTPRVRGQLPSKKKKDCAKFGQPMKSHDRGHAFASHTIFLR